MTEHAQPTGPGSAASTPSRASIALLVVLRLLALSVATELSGAMHALLDVAASVAGIEHPRDDCDDKEAGHECPPGCPNCHCAHGAVAQLAARSEPSVELGPRVLFALRNDAGFVPRDALPPKGTDPRRLYRPPRARTLS